MGFDIVCFDCDSTLSRIEGIDELARRNGLFTEVAALTDAAMNGELPLENVYAERLALIQPDKTAIDWLADLYISNLVDGVKLTIDTLHSQKKQIHIISGGLRQAILPLANYLAIPEANVHAVDVVFDNDGQYLGFDQASPLAISGGKATVCKQLSKTNLKLAMIGDGKTDLEAKLAGAYMIGFGGVVKRSLVESESDVYVSQTSLAAILPYLVIK